MSSVWVWVGVYECHRSVETQIPFSNEGRRLDVAWLVVPPQEIWLCGWTMHVCSDAFKPGSPESTLPMW